MGFAIFRGAPNEIVPINPLTPDACKANIGLRFRLGFWETILFCVGVKIYRLACYYEELVLTNLIGGVISKY
ncbi:hypothetical protein A2372_01590 [Candidatus Wolfebacteria bacterium RIFOXYB1_FULL_54_12]|uniref:Uncharacterized protein n=1 Tax=Candidatus Wolfebacteria bacterium RIFOXYB1_FULL_54_12 TaxID=1802559 RepID=A0A1F8DX18_9BACT|nr:MAG: hypothetical protein A2372_01590 [Candidatus Wolfebacteria bacterium RIFOXYB1_FULL_54_12]